jgi:hypothetical protein
MADCLCTYGTTFAARAPSREHSGSALIQRLLAVRGEL